MQGVEASALWARPSVSVIRQGDGSAIGLELRLVQVPMESHDQLLDMLICGDQVHACISVSCLMKMCGLHLPGHSSRI